MPIDSIDGDIPVGAILSSASLHDSQAAIPLAQMTAVRVASLYDLMDSAYDAPQIKAFSAALGHVPIIDANPRRGEKKEMDPAQAVRFRNRSTAERVKSNLKDNILVKTFSTEYTGKNLTKNAGLVNLGKFADKIGLPGILKRRLTIKRGVTADYAIADVVMMLMMGVLAGAKRLSHLAILKADMAIRKLFGWELFPDASAFGKLFKRYIAGFGHCHELSEAEAEAGEASLVEEMVFPDHSGYGFDGHWGYRFPGRSGEGV